MKLKIIVSLAGTGFAHAPGDIVDQPDEAEAKRWVEANFAIPYAEDPAKETRKAKKAD